MSVFSSFFGVVSVQWSERNAGRFCAEAKWYFVCIEFW